MGSYAVYRVELSITILREYTQCKPKVQPKITDMGRPPKLEGERARDITPTVVRLDPALRAALVRESHINDRSLSGEIAHRLAASLQGPQPDAYAAREPAAPFGTAPAAAEPATELATDQRLLLTLFAKLTPEKQLALLTLLRK